MGDTHYYYDKRCRDNGGLINASRVTVCTR